MAAFLSFYFALSTRGSAARRSAGHPAIDVVALAADVRRVAAQIVLFLWMALAIAFLSLVAAGLLFAKVGS